MSRHALNVSILNDTDLSTTANSKWFRAENGDTIGIQFAWTGAVVGTFTLQMSDDDGGPDWGNPTITNVTTMASSSIATSAGSPSGYDIEAATHRWYRVSFANTSSTGTWTSCRATLKGAG